MGYTLMMWTWISICMWRCFWKFCAKHHMTFSLCWRCVPDYCHHFQTLKYCVLCLMILLDSLITPCFFNFSKNRFSCNLWGINVYGRGLSLSYTNQRDRNIAKLTGYTTSNRGIGERNLDSSTLLPNQVNVFLHQILYFANVFLLI